MSPPTTVTYRGPAPFASALAQVLREEGIEVRYERPIEERGVREIAETVIVSLACSGAYDVIKAGVLRFRSSRFGGVARVEIEEDERAD